MLNFKSLKVKHSAVLIETSQEFLDKTKWVKEILNITFNNSKFSIIIF